MGIQIRHHPPHRRFNWAPFRRGHGLTAITWSVSTALFGCRGDKQGMGGWAGPKKVIYWGWGALFWPRPPL